MINFHITAENANDFETQFAGLANLMGLFRRPAQFATGEVAPADASQTSDPQPDPQPEATPETQKRTRRTKAQIEADNAAAAAANKGQPDGGQVEPGKPEEPLTQTNSSESETSTQSESSSSAAEPEVQAAEDTSDVPTVDQLRAHCVALSTKDSTFQPRLKKALSDVGVKALSDLDGDVQKRSAFALAVGYC